MDSTTKGMTIKVCPECGEFRCMVDAERAAKWLDSHSTKAHKATKAAAAPKARQQASEASGKPVTFHVGDVVTAGDRPTEFTVTEVRDNGKKLEVVTKNNRARLLSVKKDAVVRVRAKRGRPSKTA